MVYTKSFLRGIDSRLSTSFLVGSSVVSSFIRRLGHTSEGFHAGTGIFAESAFWTPVGW